MMTALNLKTWVDENRHILRPPVGNKQVWKDDQMIVMMVGGPNARKDHHYNPTPEFFYQIEGEIVVNILEGGQFYDVPIREGEFFFLPAGIPHSPRRPANTIGLVIETYRNEREDGLIWYCENCGEKLYEEYFVLHDIETQFPPIFDRFFGSEAHRTCSACGTVMQPPGQ